MVDMGNFMKTPRPRPHNFGWQLALIAAPVLILSGIALYSLRQDRAAVEQEARDRAQSLVSILGSQWRESVQKDITAFLSDYFLAKYVPVALAWPEAIDNAKPGDIGGIQLRVERARANPLLDSVPQIHCRFSDGRMETPIGYPPLPFPPDWIRALSPTQTNLLKDLETTLYVHPDPAAAARVLATMRTSHAPESALASAELEILKLRARQGAIENLSTRLTDFARRYPDATSASGTSLADLALIQALKSGASDAALRQEVFRRLMRQPSFLTPEIIVAAKQLGSQTVQALESTWKIQEEARTLLALVQKTPADPSRNIMDIWLQHNDQLVLAQRSIDEFNRNSSIKFIPGRVLEHAFLNALELTRTQIPSYLVPEVEIAGKSWPVTPHGMDLSKTNKEDIKLASWSVGFTAFPDRYKALDTRDKNLMQLAPPGDFSTVFTLNLKLTRPDLLYSSYQRRLWYGAALILAAVAAAGIGIWNAWKGFRQQLQLAEMTSNFVSSVSHELRAPLASMRLMTESLDRGRIEDEQKVKSYYRLLVQECCRLSSLVENVLDFSRIHQGRKRYEFDSIDGIALIRQTIQAMEPVAVERDISLSFQPGPGLDCQPEWDAPAVQQAVVNLIDNAIKHSPAGSVIRVGFEMIDGQKARIIVEDRGPGIKMEDRERIFEPFHRLGSELRRETRGIGIGLSIVKHVAEAHGGRVFVESTPGQGSRFTLELPLTPGNAEQP